MKNKYHKLLLFSLLFLLCPGFAACGAQAPSALRITLDGEEITTLDILNGTEQGGLYATLSPSDFEGDIIWTSEDSGIVKVTTTEDGECVLRAKKNGSVKITAECNGVSATVRVHVQKNQNNLSAKDIALTVNGVPYSAEVCNLYYVDSYEQFVADYGDYALYYGLDTSLGIQSLSEQACDYSSDGTWLGYFAESAAANIPQIQALCDYAEENGIVLSDEDTEQINAALEELKALALESGFETCDDYLADYYGTGITEEIYRDFLQRCALADAAYYSYVDSLSYSEEELSEHYLELGYEEGENEYAVTSMRHILVMAEADENGEYSEESIAAAHEKAEEIYAQWTEGEKSENSFAVYANNYSEDTGSNKTGGLYEEIYNGQMVDCINDWLFSGNREAGDTAILDNNGSYVGTHIVYFVGYGDLYSTILSREDLLSTDISDWFTALTEDYVAETGADYASIGIR